ncbi:MAG: hypothetical protein JWO83_2610 [Caulobacteraceae bacterium]|nr:hypothetical protein [Caulobacteraceae bacterium]
MRNLPNAGSATQFFATRSTDRRHRPLFFDPDEVPDFDGEEASLLAERIKGGWRIVRRVQENGEPWPD